MTDVLQLLGVSELKLKITLWECIKLTILPSALSWLMAMSSKLPFYQTFRKLEILSNAGFLFPFEPWQPPATRWISMYLDGTDQCHQTFFWAWHVFSRSQTPTQLPFAAAPCNLLWISRKKSCIVWMLISMHIVFSAHE